MMRTLHRKLNGPDDAGIALLTVVLVSAVLMALGLSAVAISGHNLAGAGRDRVGGAALAAAEAGVAQGMEYIKQGTIQNPPCQTACTVSLPDGRSATVTIKVVQKFDPANGYRVGTFLITAAGSAGTGPGLRTLQATVTAKPYNFPIGIFTEQQGNLGGNGTIYTESLFSQACIDSRSHIAFTGTDAYYGGQAGAHSTTYINDKNDNGCSKGPSQSIHNSSRCIAAGESGDQDNGAATKDASGNPVSFVSTDACWQKTTSNSPNYTQAQLVADTGFINGGLTPGQYAALAATARSTHHYSGTADFVWPCYATCPAGQSPEVNPVVYFNGGINPPSLADYKWQTPNAGCTNVQPSIVFVVRNGTLTLNGGTDLTGNFFVPEGQITANGGMTMHGTMFAQTLKFTGGAYSELNACQVKNFPSPITDVQLSHFHEKDR